MDDDMNWFDWIGVIFGVSALLGMLGLPIWVGIHQHWDYVYYPERLLRAECSDSSKRIIEYDSRNGDLYVNAETGNTVPNGFGYSCYVEIIKRFDEAYQEKNKRYESELLDRTRREEGDD